MRVGIVAHLDEDAVALCRERLSADDVLVATPGESGPGWSESLSRCEVVFGTVPPSWIPRLTSLRWLQLESIGFEYYGDVSPEIERRGIRVTNLQGQFAHPAAETALAGVLALARGLDELVLAGEDRRWVGLEVRPRMTLVHGSRVVVLGNGSIGKQVRRLFEGFECRVLSFARTSPDAELHSLEALDDALADADIVVNCLPSTPATRRLFDAERIARMQRHTVFVNVGRGSAVDEEALGDALVSGAIGGAVLDVTVHEPLDATSRLWGLPRTILTQHTGGGYREELLDKAHRFLENLDRWRNGQPLMHEVDWQMGY